MAENIEKGVAARAAKGHFVWITLGVSPCVHTFQDNSSGIQIQVFSIGLDSQEIMRKSLDESVIDSTIYTTAKCE